MFCGNPVTQLADNSGQHVKFACRAIENPCTVDESLVDQCFTSSYRRGYPLTVEPDRDDMPSSQDQLAQTLRGLQINANRCARMFTTRHLKVQLQVAFSNDAPLPWRLLEIHRAVHKAGEPRVLRRMHCFRDAESLELSIQERMTWKARDRELVSSHLVRVHAALDKPGSGRSGEQDAAPPNGSDADLLALTATRQALRAQMCSTRPGRVVDLPKGRC
ncbi:MAG: hypothetical protein JWL65_3086 [Gammaproteobacteria bacterium]|nr:hypothetical protein [Gammaproteobacteria bacterium]